MSIKCGSCGDYHDSIQEVRACAATSHGLGLIKEPVGNPDEEAASAALDALLGEPKVANPPSDKQVKYALDLLTMHEWPDTLTKEDLLGMERRQVSRLISDIQTKPRKEIGADGPKIPNGRYALRRESDGEWVFWEVYTAEQGQWAGRTFVKHLIGAPGDYRKERVSRDVMKSVLKRIEDITPRQASIDYGLKSEVCGVCSSPLSNPESLAAGIGPVCRSKMGW